MSPSQKGRKTVRLAFLKKISIVKVLKTQSLLANLKYAQEPMTTNQGEIVVRFML